MNLVDANVLIYAVNSDSTHHEVSKRWLDASLNGASTVGFAWVALLAFLRLATKHGVFPSPLSVEAASSRVEGWLSAPSAVVVHPTARHASTLASLLREVGTGANLVNDAHLAALAIEHRATVVTFDSDFVRFQGVRSLRPE